MVIRAIPPERLCPTCRRGWLIHEGSPSGKLEGPHEIMIYRRCDRCGYRTKSQEIRVGIEETQPSPFGHCPDLPFKG